MSVRRTGSTAVLRLQGEADIAVAHRLRLRLSDLVADVGVERVVVDLVALEFLDLTALEALTDAADRLRERRGDLVLRSPGRRVRRLLDLARPRLVVEP